MSRSNRPADWQLPPGVARATFDYISNQQIALKYDDFHAGHPLLQLDQMLVKQVIDEAASRSAEPLQILDLGCGTGRSLQYAIQQGHHTVGVDLSPTMLQCAQKKTHELISGQSKPARDRWVEANMIELDFLGEASIDVAMCLYSSFGMLRGQKFRLQCLQHVRRILRPEGRFVIHVHNRRNWWTTAAGRKLIFRDFWHKLIDRRSHEFGDRTYAYRNLPAMYLHIFSRGELVGLLRAADFQIKKFHYLNQSSAGFLQKPWFCPQIRSAGFIVIATAR